MGIKEIAQDLVHRSDEEEWFEFKENWFEIDELGEYISALSNIVYYKSFSQRLYDGIKNHGKQRKNVRGYFRASPK